MLLKKFRYFAQSGWSIPCPATTGVISDACLKKQLHLTPLLEVIFLWRSEIQTHRGHGLTTLWTGTLEDVFGNAVFFASNLHDLGFGA
jgi:hypothetical protein